MTSSSSNKAAAIEVRDWNDCHDDRISAATNRTIALAFSLLLFIGLCKTLKLPPKFLGGLRGISPFVSLSLSTKIRWSLNIGVSSPSRTEIAWGLDVDGISSPSEANIDMPLCLSGSLLWDGIQNYSTIECGWLWMQKMTWRSRIGLTIDAITQQYSFCVHLVVSSTPALARASAPASNTASTSALAPVLDPPYGSDSVSGFSSWTLIEGA